MKPESKSVAQARYKGESLTLKAASGEEVTGLPSVLPAEISEELAQRPGALAAKPRRRSLLSGP